MHSLELSFFQVKTEFQKYQLHHHYSIPSRPIPTSPTMNSCKDNNEAKTSGVIPCLEPSDKEISSNIKNLVYSVLENGKDFEEHVLAAENGNSAYNFLTDCTDEGFYFYRWTLYCIGDCLRPEVIAAIVDNHRRYILSCYPGALDLTVEGHASFDRLLGSIDGSKHSIRLFRGWVLKHAHSIISIAMTMERFISQLINRPETFNKLLHILYGLNDVLFNASLNNMVGPYTKLLILDGDTSFEDRRVDILQCLFKTLGCCLHATFTAAVDDAGRGKCSKIIELWRSKNFITDEQQQSLLASMLSGISDNRYISNISIKSPYAPSQFLYLDAMVGGSGQSFIPAHPLVNTISPPLPPSRPFPNNESVMNSNQQGFPPYPFINFQGGPLPLPFPPPPPPPPPQAPMAFYTHQPNSGILQSPMNNFMSPSGLMPGFHTSGLPGSNPFQGTPMQPIKYPLPQTSLLAPFIDLSKLPVGGLSNIVKFAVKSGHRKYSPIDVAAMILPSMPHVEPGRLEVRVNDFYKKLNDALLEIDKIAAKRQRREAKAQAEKISHNDKVSKDHRGNKQEDLRDDDSSAFYGPGRGLGWK